MAIEEYSPRSRSNALWVGQAAPADTVTLLTQLGFSLDEPSISDLSLSDGVLAGAAGIAFIQTDANQLEIVSALGKHVARLLDHGCLVFVLTTPNGLARVKEELTGLKVPSIWPASEGYEVFNGKYVNSLSDVGTPPMPYVRVYRSEVSPEQDIVNMLVRNSSHHPPAPDVTADVPGIFRITTGPAISNICATHRLMLRRSFHDCEDIHLDYASDVGRSGVAVYIVHATVKPPFGARNPSPARRQLPFFVKIGPRWKIIPEWRNYEERVRRQVPFHLAPRLVAERCELGANTGIIVGDFVEDSESLGECSRSGRAMTPIGTLFDRTLRGWHSHADPKNNIFYRSLRSLLDGDISASRIGIAEKTLSVKLAPNDIKSRMRVRPAEEMLWGPIHGDLHADNIRVRGSDAILIDFCSARDGPVLADPAALEVSLAIRVPTNDERFDRDAWLRTIKRLFSKEVLHRPPAIHNPTEPYAWIASCIRQVRLHALPMQRTPDQYAHVLAYYFLQAAIKDPKIKSKKDPYGHEDFRRGIAYGLAVQLET